MKNKILKKILFKIIKLCPFNSVRLFIYRNFFKYTIGTNVFIGKSILNSKKVTIGNNVVIKNNCIITAGNVTIGNNTSIHSGNVIMGKASFSIGNNSRIINDHFIDVWNSVEIGNNTWLAGKASQLWTHGSIYTKTGKKDLSIKIGDNIYMASNCSIAPGVTIESLNLIGLGSVVTQSISSSKNIIAGNPAKIIKENIDWRENW
ncbi:acyltransferase [Ulvibacter litoralis]|uniref:Transferase hexapeptide (Six repeat-containing protein) n=1 Tax=Ulvibacter litoralis TaxID=227084 RepID=A0A1G7DAF6_9FLAO|nr:hypothetical protein [Ulvibacter litoralis]GHC44287.1 hypothetical protein GCM10008083_03490 [Ulvibacter litoralis]SDE48541.1 hypothetical protein SAMN05421855_101858 [Ulvibacter litoralis]